MIIQGKTNGEWIKVEIMCDVIDVTPIRERDPQWVCVDKQGHRHTWHKPKGAEYQSKDHLWELPTLRAVSYICGYSDDGDPMYKNRYYCKKCGEQVWPGYRPTMFRRFASGAKQCYINDMPVDKKTAIKMIKKLEKEYGVLVDEEEEK